MNRLMRLRICILIVFAFTAIIAAGLIESRSRVSIADQRASGLEARPDSIHMDNVLPGRYSGKFELVNNGGRKLNNIVITRSCFCVSLQAGDRIDTLGPLATAPIRFTIDAPEPGKMSQVITVRPAGGPELHATIYMNVSRVLPAVGRDGLTIKSLERSDPGSVSPPEDVYTHVADGALNSSVAVDVPWLAIRSEQIKRELHVRVSARRLAPEGAFALPAHVRYTTVQGEQEYDITLKGSVKSRVRLDPPAISFGYVPDGSPSSIAQCTLTLDRAPGDLIHVSTSDSRVAVTASRRDEHEYVILAHLRASRPGEINARADIFDGNRRIATVPISGFIGR